MTETTECRYIEAPGSDSGIICETHRHDPDACSEVVTGLRTENERLLEIVQRCETGGPGGKPLGPYFYRNRFRRLMREAGYLKAALSSSRSARTKTDTQESRPVEQTPEVRAGVSALKRAETREVDELLERAVYALMVRHWPPCPEDTDVCVACWVYWHSPKRIRERAVADIQKVLG